MPLIVGKSHNPIVREAFALKAVSERRMKRIASMTKAKPEPSKTAKSPRAKGGKPKEKA
jgi:hypothetical protein